MKVAVPKETAAGERRVALVPESVGPLVKAGLEVLVERDAGAGAFFSDADYEKAGAKIVAQPLSEAVVVAKVQKPTANEVGSIREGAVLIGFLQPAPNSDL